jgi:hypothetical protein
MNVLDTVPVVSTLRRNHGVEHATIHVLTSHVSPLAVAGHATLDGFNLFGEVITQDVINAANEALARLRNGESRLVIHPNCGTNFATAGTIVGAAAWLAGLGRGTVSKLPRVIIASTMALMFALPFGLLVQEHVTTSPLIGDARVLGVERTRRGHLTVHHVRLG